MVIGIPIWGLGSGVNTIVSNILGQKKVADVIPATIKSAHISFAISFVICAAIFLLPKTFLGFYSKEIADMHSAVMTLYVVLGAMLLFSVGAMTMHAVMGIGDTRTLLFMEMIAITMYVVYTYMAVFIWELTLPQIWMSEFVYWTIIPVLTIAYLRAGRWKKIGLSY